MVDGRDGAPRPKNFDPRGPGNRPPLPREVDGPETGKPKLEGFVGKRFGVSSELELELELC